MAYPGYPPHNQQHLYPTLPNYPNVRGGHFSGTADLGYQFQPPPAAEHYHNAPYPGGLAGNPTHSNHPQSGYAPPQIGFGAFPGAPLESAPYPVGGQTGFPPYPTGGARASYPASAYPPVGQMGPTYQPPGVHAGFSSSYPSASATPHYNNPYTIRGQHSTGIAYQPQSHMQVYQQKFNPTIRPKVPYGPAEEEGDAAALRRAMKGFGTDERAIIAILSKRTNQQRQQIAKRYTALYGKDLLKDLRSETSGNFRDVIIACMTPMDQFYAKELHDAVAGLGTNETTLIEVLCSLNNTSIHAIKNAYKLKYKRSLETDIRGDTSGHFARLLHSLCQCLRDENPNVNHAQVSADVQALYTAGQGKWGTDESIFNSILVTRSLPHLREVFRLYHQTHRTPFERVIKSEFSGSIKNGLLAIVKCMTNCPEYFAERLHETMAGAGTSDRALIRLIVTRSECDLGDIKVAFHHKYGKSLESFIEGDCSGDYKRILIAMVTSGFYSRSACYMKTIWN